MCFFFNLDLTVSIMNIELSVRSKNHIVSLIITSLLLQKYYTFRAEKLNSKWKNIENSNIQSIFLLRILQKTSI